MSLVPVFALLVPRPFTRPQAQQAEKRLRQLIDAIWHVHGPSMGQRPPPTRVRLFIARLVPPGWSGPQALRAVGLLNEAVTAIWEVCEEDDEHLGRFDAWNHEDDDIPF